MSKYLENKKLNVLDIGYTLNPQNSSPNQAKKPEKSREKVAETAEIPKTAPELSQKSPKKLPNPAQKVAEITINFKTVKKIRLLLKRIEIH